MATVLDKQTKNNLNRQQFAREIDARQKSVGQRLGLFSHPICLTVGDASTNYQKDRRPAQEIGKMKNFSNNRGKSTTTETFNKLVSNAIGDEYQDVGKYFLRTDAGKKSISSRSFKPSGGHKLVKNSEFKHQKEYDIHQPGSRKVPVNFLARSTSDSFQKKFMYTEDAYERKEDMRKLDYQRRAALILDKSQPYTTSVFQHGTFDPFRKTYGSDRDFMGKPGFRHDPPQFGPFKIGNLPKKGYNKCLGKNPAYIEDPVEDSVTY